MKHILLIITLLIYSKADAQTVTTKLNNYTIIQNKGAVQKIDCAFCNHRTISDRVVLDSAGVMVARRITNPYGYTYYEWRNKNYQKSFEVLVVNIKGFLTTAYFTDSGQFLPPGQNHFIPSNIHYYRQYYERRLPYNGDWTAERITIEMSKNENDSMYKLYKIPENKRTAYTKFHYELSFHRNGQIKSFGTIITGLKQTTAATQSNTYTDTPKTDQSVYSIGKWILYNEQGLLQQEVLFNTLRKIREG
jgi:hypothetical protein